jgi:hypothetical protein
MVKLEKCVEGGYVMVWISVLLGTYASITSNEWLSKYSKHAWKLHPNALEFMLAVARDDLGKDAIDKEVVEKVR